jgi:hypothetical protein
MSGEMSGVRAISLRSLWATAQQSNAKLMGRLKGVMFGRPG